jgi:site-specific DNA recombinase
MDKPTKLLRTGFYARVSSDCQRVDSQVADLVRKAREDGCVLLPEHHFIDDGYSGESLLRPGLERLRDQVVAGLLDRVYVLAPDRLSRNFVHQMLLYEEFARYGVEVVYLNRPLSNSAEDVLLGQIQAAVAEYERTRILDRGRRGRLNAARQGCVNVLSGAPFGYRYIDKHTGGGQARYEIAEPQAEVVREIFRLVGEKRWTLRRVCKYLQEKGVPTNAGMECEAVKA